MDFNKLLDRKMAYAIIVLFFAAAAVIAFQKGTLSDADYAMLIKSGITLENMALYSDALIIALPLAVYLLAAYALKADEFHALIAAILLAIGGVSAASFFSIAPLIAIALGKQYDLFSALKIAGAVLPLGLVAIAGYRKEKAAAALAIIGALILPFAPGVSVILLALAASKGIGLLENEPYGDKAIVLVVMVFTFQGAYAGDLTAAVVVSVLVAGIAYIATALHNVKKDEVAALLMLFVAFSTVAAIYSISAADAIALQQSEISAFKAAGSMAGQFSVFDYPNAFAYYSGKNAAVLNSSAIARKGSNLTGTVVFSARSLDAAYGEKPVIFAYAGATQDVYNRTIAVFANKRYALYMRVQGSELAIEEAQVFDTTSGEGTVIPFTKVKQLFAGNFSSPQIRMVNVQEIDASALYTLLFKSNASFSGNGTQIVGG